MVVGRQQFFRGWRKFRWRGKLGIMVGDESKCKNEIGKLKSRDKERSNGKNEIENSRAEKKLTAE